MESTVFVIRWLSLLLFNYTHSSYRIQALQQLPDLQVVLWAAGTPQCLRPCVRNLIGIANRSLKYKNLFTSKNVEEFCSAYKNAEQCALDKSECDRTCFNAVTQGLRSFCGERIPFVKFVLPCLETYADGILQNCDSDCSLSSSLAVVSSNVQVKKLAMGDGDPAILLKHFGSTCESYICYLSCAQRDLNKNCPGTGMAFVGMLIEPLEFAGRILSTVSDSMKDAIVAAIPKTCVPLLDSSNLNMLKYFGLLPKPQI